MVYIVVVVVVVVVVVRSDTPSHSDYQSILFALHFLEWSTQRCITGVLWSSSSSFSRCTRRESMQIQVVTLLGVAWSTRKTRW